MANDATLAALAQEARAAQAGYRRGFVDGAEAALRGAFGCWPPAERNRTWRHAYRQGAGYVAKLERWAERDAGLLASPPRWP